MRVRATRMGYREHRRIREGEEFDMPDSSIAKDKDGNIVKPKWVEPADKPRRIVDSGPRKTQSMADVQKKGVI